MIFKKKYKRSEWFMGLLDCEQHVYEGHSADFLANVVDKKLYQDKISIEAHRGVYDYLWYFENKLKADK